MKLFRRDDGVWVNLSNYHVFTIEIGGRVVNHEPLYFAYAKIKQRENEYDNDEMITRLSVGFESKEEAQKALDAILEAYS